jgi:hypothetical protein
VYGAVRPRWPGAAGNLGLYRSLTLGGRNLCSMLRQPASRTGATWSLLRCPTDERTLSVSRWR